MIENFVAETVNKVCNEQQRKILILSYRPINVRLIKCLLVNLAFIVGTFG